ncbi:MAG: cytochrome c oxidase subunit 3 family protein [Deltaproteobacteria bacterium]|nr:cytochrome c oxidase subunit 3 family protein [Deltaproteobacteria bacterium]
MSTEAHGDSHFLQHHYDTPAQQFNAAKLGMWLFLAQELLFFGGLFVAYGVFRSWYPQAWVVGSHLLDYRMGALNTAVLLLSSFTAVMAVRSAQTGNQKATGNFLLATIALAGVFMVVKYFEYAHKFEVGFLPGSHFAPHGVGLAEIVEAARESGVNGVPYHLRTFFGLYFVMTGVHGLHVLIGMFVMGWMWNRNRKGEFSTRYSTPVEMTALYWHLVDIIWIFLFPLLYLID